MELDRSIQTNTNWFADTPGDSAPKFFSRSLAIGALVVALFLPAVALSKSPTSPRSSQSHGRAIAPQRIKFAIGAVSAQTAGQFTPANERVSYVIKAKAGGHMIVNIIPVTKTLTMGGTVKTPSGAGDGGPGGIIMNADLTESGDYTIEVSQHTMGSNLASGKFILEVVITPAWLKS
jgi:hypothetical protein